MNDSYSQSISGGEKYKELCKRAMKRLIDDFGWEPERFSLATKSVWYSTGHWAEDVEILEGTPIVKYRVEGFKVEGFKSAHDVLREQGEKDVKIIKLQQIEF